MDSSAPLQPHQLLLFNPATTKPKRRTLHLDLSTYSKRDRTSPDQVHVRELALHHGALGCAVWDGSIILARWMHRHPDLFRGGVGLELGAGIGVPGIVAARYASRMLLTDYIQDVVDNLAYNLALNANTEQEEEDGETNEAEVARRQALRHNVKASGGACMLDFHAIDPDEEDMVRLKWDGILPPAPLPPSPEVSSLPFTPSPYWVDPTGLGALSCDFLVGAEVVYTPNAHHQHCIMRILQYYLKPGGIFYYVGSQDREGAGDFMNKITQEGFHVLWQEVSIDKSGLTGHYRDNKKGFIQREEPYNFYIIQKAHLPPQEQQHTIDVDALSIPGSKLRLWGTN